MPSPQKHSCPHANVPKQISHSLNQETNSLISSLHQPLNYRKRLPNASKPWSLSLGPTFQLRLLHTGCNELDREKGKQKKQKNSRHPFIVCTGKSADYCNRTKHLLGFILLIYSWQLSDWWRGVRLKVAGGVAFLSPRSVLIVFFSL